VGNVLVTVIAVHGSRVKLGFQGPRETIVEREEVADRRKAGAGNGELAMILDHDIC
jgi:sRNA-binding carbon storage regulator CsrA